MSSHGVSKAQGSGPQGVLGGIEKEEKEVLCWGPCCAGGLALCLVA